MDKMYWWIGYNKLDIFYKGIYNESIWRKEALLCPRKNSIEQGALIRQNLNINLLIYIVAASISVILFRNTTLSTPSWIITRSVSHKGCPYDNGTELSCAKVIYCFYGMQPPDFWSNTRKTAAFWLIFCDRTSARLRTNCSHV